MNAYDSSSTDEILGRVEAKLYRRIFERLKGMGNLLPPDEDPPASRVAIEQSRVPADLPRQLEASQETVVLPGAVLPAGDPDEIEEAISVVRR